MTMKANQTMQRFELTLPEHSHSVAIGQEILETPQIWPTPSGHNHKALVCIDRAVSQFWPKIEQGLQNSGWKATRLELTGQEELKSIEKIYPIYAELLSLGLQRRSLIVAVGGGTIGDAIGFVAASYLRGVPWVNVPTTMLAQVDSCLGGKTGINHQAGKNLIGAFHQPSAIICDLDFLHGLDQRDRVSGLGEMFKYGLIKDQAFWSYLKGHKKAILKSDPDILTRAVRRSLEIKAEYVKADVYDLTGIRAELNFGHTFGHAIEQISNYGYYRHGEAVLLGMSMACEVSQALGLIAPEVALEIQRELEDLPLPTWPEQISVARMLDVMQHDKKNDGSEISCLLINSPGQICSKKLTAKELSEPMHKWIQRYMTRTNGRLR